jgi:hypothetical protein
LPSGSPQGLGHRRVEGVGAGRLGHALGDEVDQVAEVDGHQDVGGRALAFGEDALGDAVFRNTVLTVTPVDMVYWSRIGWIRPGSGVM